MRREFREKIMITVPAAVLLLALYFLIFGFSAQDGETSGSLSMQVAEEGVDFLDLILGGHWDEAVKESIASYFEHPLRKMAHFGEYACMGILVFCIWSQWMKRGGWLYALTVTWVFFSAGMDEFHQLFVPGRYGCFQDVLLDTVGGACGMLLCRGIARVITNKKRKL